MKKIFVVGGAGSIGSELSRQLSKDNKVIVVDQDKFEEKDIISEVCNVTDYAGLEKLFEKHRPDVVIHAAAYKYVAQYEKEFYAEIIAININGTINLVKLSKKYNVDKFVYISTDKAVNPTSLMGTTKLVSEIITKRNGYVVVRFGNVIDSRGSVTQIWKKQVENGEPLTITDDRMERYFMSIPEACQLVIKASEIGKSGETLILDMGEPVKIIDMAKRFSDNIKIIGAKQGEKLNEELMTENEKEKAIKKDKYWIIP